MRHTPPNFIDITGQTFSKLTVIKRDGKNKEGKATWLCKCECGKESIVTGKQLRTGKTRSCGCLLAEVTAARSTTHGMARRGNKNKLYSTWMKIKQRCHNETCSDYYLYGATGISVCDRWRNSFQDFYDDIISAIGHRPNKMSLDRFPNKYGNYEPGNVRWGTDEMQANNKRNNRMLTHDGRTMTLMMWSREVGIHNQTIAWRLEHGMSVSDALTMPIRKNQHA